MTPRARRVLAVAIALTAIVAALLLRPVPSDVEHGAGHQHGAAGPDPVTTVALLANVATLAVIGFRSWRRRATGGVARPPKTWTYRG